MFHMSIKQIIKKKFFFFLKGGFCGHWAFVLLLREVREEKPERQNGLNCLSRKCLRLGPQREGSSGEPGGRERGAGGHKRGNSGHKMKRVSHCCCPVM